MIIDVSQQLKEPLGSTRHYRINETSDCPDGEELSIQGEITLLRTDRSILMTGLVNTRIKAVCSRCLGDFDQPLTLNLEDEFVPVVELATGASLPELGEDGAFAINENQEIDLCEVVRQYALLALPMKPLCRKDCAGLCPSCGHNLKLGSCSCPPAVDPRFAELAKLVLGEERKT
jgi:uncharacterized protein